MSISTAVIVAAGKGRRMGTEISKQFLPLCGKEILAHTVEKFEKAACIRDIILVTGGDALQDVRQMAQEYGWKKIISVTEGGKERQDSVFLGLQQVPQDTEIVLIHDGVRPLINGKLISDNIESVKRNGSAITCVRVNETVLEVKEDGEIANIPKREDSRLARAPQSFWLSEILKVHEKALSENKIDFIDSCSMMKYYGYKLYLIEGPSENIKITTPEDFYIMRALLDAKENTQIYGVEINE